MANNKFMLRDGTVLLDLTSDTATADRILQGFTAHDASGAAITGTWDGSSPSPYLDIFFGLVISATNGVTLIDYTIANHICNASFSEAQAGYEGFNIALRNLTVGASYVVNFDFQYTDAEWFANLQYRSGVNVWDTNYAAYTDYTHWTENLDRDLNKHNHRITFTATETTMYLSFNVCGLADGRTNYFEITNFYVEAVQ